MRIFYWPQTQGNYDAVIQICRGYWWTKSRVLLPLSKTTTLRRELVLVSEDLAVHALLIRLGRSSDLRRIFVPAQSVHRCREVLCYRERA